MCWQVEQSCRAWISDVADSLSSHAIKLLQSCLEASTLHEAEEALHTAIISWRASPLAAAASNTVPSANVTPGGASSGTSGMAQISVRHGKGQGNPIAPAAADGVDSGSDRLPGGGGAADGRAWEEVSKAVLGQELNAWQVSKVPPVQ